MMLAVTNPFFVIERGFEDILIQNEWGFVQY